MEAAETTATRDEEALADGRSNARPSPRPIATPRSVADAEAARRLLARRGAALGRIADLRRRRARAYQLLVRAGFEADLAAEVARSVAAEDVGDEVDLESAVDADETSDDRTGPEERGQAPDDGGAVPTRHGGSPDRSS